MSETGLKPNDKSHVSDTGFKLCQLLSLSDVPQPLSPAAQAAQPRPLNPLLACLTCLPLAQTCHPASAQVCVKQALPIQQPAQAQLGPARPAEVSGATSSPAARQPATHPPSPATRPAPSSQHTSRLSPACQGEMCLRLAAGQRLSRV